VTPYLHAVRALTTLLFRRLAVPLAWFVGGIFTITIATALVLTIAVSIWWGLALIVILPLATLTTGLGAFGWLMSERLLPRRLTSSEHEQLIVFTDKIITVAEARATPLPILGLYVARDLIAHPKNTYVETLITNVTSLRSDFTQIVKIFR
jgi:hypothetical protein